MTKLKLCSKMHIFIIISVLFIAIGMAVGSACNFISNGFFNYGGEFAPYRCITVTYGSISNEDKVKPVCEEVLSSINAYEKSYTQTKMGGEIVYKYVFKTDEGKLEAAVNELNTKLKDTENDYSLGVASLHTANVNVGGARALRRVAIALSAAAALSFLYSVFRYKLRAALSAFIAGVHNLGIFVALAAITRIPVGTEIMAIGAAVVVVTMIFSCIFFDRTRKNFKAEKYAKTERREVVDLSAQESFKITLFVGCAILLACLIVGACAAISSLFIGAFAPYALAALGMVACLYGSLFFVPALHGGMDKAFESRGNKSAKGKKPSKDVKEDKADGGLVKDNA